MSYNKKQQQKIHTIQLSRNRLETIRRLDREKRKRELINKLNKYE